MMSSEKFTEIGFEVLGEHGAEIVPAAVDGVPRLARVLEAVEAQIHQPGIIVENKGGASGVIGAAQTARQ